MNTSGRDNELMSKEVYEAAMYDNDNGSSEVSIIDTFSDEELLKKTFVLNNILHIGVMYDNKRFVRDALSRFPHLIWEENLDKDTPLHFAAVTNNSELVEVICKKQKDLTLLRFQNLMGNTPLHVAIINLQFEVVFLLVDKDPYLAGMVNASMEAPLHLALKHFPFTMAFLEDYEDLIEADRKNKDLLKRMEQKNWGYIRWGSTIENMVRLIGLLLEIASYVAGWRDASGLTPLHRAAQLEKCYNLPVLKLIIEYCPHSMEVRDSSGKTILHHLIHRILYLPRGLDFLRKTRMFALIHHRDLDGNTPLHLATINYDPIMQGLLKYGFNASKDIKNNQGMSTTQMLIADTTKVETPKMSIKTSRLAELGDVFKLRAYAEKLQFIGLDEVEDSNGRKVTHKLVDIKSGNLIIPTAFLGFMEYLGDVVPRMLFALDNNSDTLVHILVKLNPNIMIHLATGTRDDPTYTTENLDPHPLPDGCRDRHSSFSNYTYTWENLGRTTFLVDLLKLCLRKLCIGSEATMFISKNLQGNTSLHEAAKAKNYPVLKELAEYFRKSKMLVNNHNETVLHLLAPLNLFPHQVSKEVMDDIIKSNTEDESHDLDENGLSPVMIAIEAGNIEFAKRLIEICPRLAGVRDTKGNTFWHHFVKAPPVTPIDFASATEDLLSLLENKNYEENTALHVAIDERRFDVARLFLILHRTHQTHNNPKTNLLRIPDKKGDTPGNKIGSLSYLPDEFERFIWEDYTMIGTRSIWGIPTPQIKEYVNTIGVIAALLTTITFTAAFTVPGGLNQEKGTPLLIDVPAFQVFIISDVLAMCLSMMVLFCLMWIMATGDKNKSVVLLDFSIILLLASFYTTLLTFMTGFYATLHLVKLWIAIFSLVPCSLLLLLMHKYLVNKWIIPSGKRILLFFAKTSYSTKKAFRSRHNNSQSNVPV